MYQKVLTFLVLLVESVSDVRKRSVSTAVLLLYLGLAILGHFCWSDFSWKQLSAGLLPGISGLLLSVCTRESLGYGDSLMILVMGISLGALPVIQIVVEAFFLSGILAVFLWFLKKEPGQSFPFIPFLFLGLILYWSGG